MTYVRGAVAALIAAVLVGAAGNAGAGPLDDIKKNAEIRLAYRVDAAPFSFKDAEGHPAGYQVNLCLEVAAALQLQLGLPKLTATFTEVTAANRFDAITTGNADLLCEATSATLSRREKMDFSIPTFISGASLAILKDGPTSVDQLAGKTIAVLGGTTTEQALAETLKEGGITATVVTVKTHDEGFDLLQKKEIVAYFGDRTILAVRLRDKTEYADVLLAENYLTIEPYALAMPIDHDFRLAVDTALSHLFRTGGMIKVFRRSFDPADKPTELLKALSRMSGLPE